MPQGNVPQFSGHNYTTSETGVKYRTVNSGNPLSHDDVDANFDILRKAINGLVADLGLANSNSSSGISSVQSDLSTTQADLSTAQTDLSSLQSTVTALQAEVSGIETNVTNITNGTTDIHWDQITGAPDQLNNADTNGATFGDTVNGIPAIELTYPAGPRIRGGVQGTTFVNDDGTGWSGITAESLTLNGGSQAVPTDASSLIWNGAEGLTLSPVSNGQAYVAGDLKVSGKIIAEGDLVVDGDLEDSSGNSVGGGGPWQSCNVNFLSNQHISSAGTNLTIDIHNSLPNAIEVCMEVTCNEQHLQYYNVYTKSWVTILNVANNVYGQSRVSIPLAPGNVSWFASGSNANIVTPDIIAPGTIRLYGVGADSNGGTIYAFKAIYWR